MPTYDYICRSCGHEFELFQQMSDSLKRKCPKCGKPKLERLIGIGAGVLFKGGGFYETDYRSDSYKKAAEAEKKSAEPKAETSKTADGAKTPATAEGASKSESATPEKSAAPSSESSEKKSPRRAGSKSSAKPKPTPKVITKRSKKR